MAISPMPAKTSWQILFLKSEEEEEEEEVPSKDALEDMIRYLVGHKKNKNREGQEGRLYARSDRWGQKKNHQFKQ